MLYTSGKLTDKAIRSIQICAVAVLVIITLTSVMNFTNQIQTIPPYYRIAATFILMRIFSWISILLMGLFIWIIFDKKTKPLEMRSLVNNEQVLLNPTQTHGASIICKCGYVFSNEVKFCTDCGIERPKETEASPVVTPKAKMFCAGCGSQLSSVEAKFCTGCGKEQ
jgi:uncharacterized membrane protein